jgi:glycosyltransferase involved in cell wall biosynthesis
MSPRTKPQISVVIPVFNEVKSLPELLARCLAAMRATGRSFELVLVDDGSTDGSSALLAERANWSPCCSFAISGSTPRSSPGSNVPAATSW